MILKAIGRRKEILAIEKSRPVGLYRLLRLLVAPRIKASDNEYTIKLMHVRNLLNVCHLCWCLFQKVDTYFHNSTLGFISGIYRNEDRCDTYIPIFSHSNKAPVARCSCTTHRELYFDALLGTLFAKNKGRQRVGCLACLLPKGYTIHDGERNTLLFVFNEISLACLGVSHSFYSKHSFYGITLFLTICPMDLMNFLLREREIRWFNLYLQVCFCGSDDCGQREISRGFFKYFYGEINYGLVDNFDFIQDRQLKKFELLSECRG